MESPAITTETSESEAPPTKAEIKEQLDSRKKAIEQRIETLQGEVENLGPSMVGRLLKNPVVSMGAMVMAGLAVGWLVGGRKKKSSSHASVKDSLLQEHLDRTLKEIQRRVSKGEDFENALHSALAERPLVIYETQHKSSSKGVISKSLSMLLQHAMPMALNMVSQYIEAKVEEGNGEAPERSNSSE